jgi:hypothetical protein
MVYLNLPNKINNQKIDSIIACNYATQSVLTESNVNNEMCEILKINQQPIVQKALVTVVVDNLEPNKLVAQ